MKNWLRIGLYGVSEESAVNFRRRIMMRIGVWLRMAKLTVVAAMALMLSSVGSAAEPSARANGMGTFFRIDGASKGQGTTSVGRRRDLGQGNVSAEELIRRARNAGLDDDV
jgi:hypothetical protein